MKPFARIAFNRPADAIEAQAAEWMVRRDGGLSAAETRDLAAWLAADPRRADAFTQLEAAWSTLNAPRLAGRGAHLLHAEAILEQRQRRRRQVLWAGSSLAAAAALVVSLRFTLPSPTSIAPPTSSAVVVCPDRQTLTDGSVIELAAGAEVKVDFSAARRAVHLMRGQALFHVAHDVARPFVVSAGAIAVRAVGTEFAVRLTTDEIAVLVTEGRVAVEPPAPGDRPAAAAPAALVSAGNLLVLPTGHSVASLPVAKSVEPAEIAKELAWRHHRIEFAATTLAEAVALMNRQNQRQLVLGDAATARLRITGVFWTDDPAGFARLLEASLGLKANSRSDGAIVLSQ